MVNENGMVDSRSADGDLRPALPRFNASTPITPQLHHSNPSRPIGLGLVEYSSADFSPAPGKSKTAKCAIVLHNSTASGFSPPPWIFFVVKKPHLSRGKTAFEAEGGES